LSPERKSDDLMGLSILGDLKDLKLNNLQNFFEIKKSELEIKDMKAILKSLNWLPREFRLDMFHFQDCSDLIKNGI
jgi:hypothetical protein